MPKPVYVRFETPKELVEKAYQVAELASDTGKVCKGTNEVTKRVDRGEAQLVIIAEDVTPPEVVAHLPILCDEKRIPYLYVPNKQELGVSSGLKKPTASISIVDAGAGKELLAEIVTAIEPLRKK
jgi:large subunit ribosomal protein L7Ae